MLLSFFSFGVYFLTGLALATSEWIEYPDSGYATMTHYTMPPGYIASCGCTGASTKYPMSQMAYGSSLSYGPACGRCFDLRLVNPVVATPPFHPNIVKSVVIKVTDLCPLSSAGWCSGTRNKPNSAGAYLNFDLVYPSSAIPDDFFPSNVSLYGYKDFGVWNISYQRVSCLSNWGGSKNAAAFGSVTSLGTNTCCPWEPQPGNSSASCSSYSDKNGIPPDTRTSHGMTSSPLPPLHLVGAFMLSYYLTCYITISYTLVSFNFCFAGGDQIRMQSVIIYCA